MVGVVGVVGMGWAGQGQAPRLPQASCQLGFWDSGILGLAWP